MKKISILLVVIAFAFTCCQNSGNKNDTSNEGKIPAAIEEANALDSISNEIEKTKDDIEESTKKLDELINEL